MEQIEFTKEDDSVPTPGYATKGSSGMDLCAYLTDCLTLVPGQRVLVPTGLTFAIPQGFELQLRPRSGLALKYGLTLMNAIGTIDSDYRGKVGVILVNLGQENVTIAPGDRICQAVLCPVSKAELVEVKVLDVTDRGSGGFGSTGK